MPADLRQRISNVLSYRSYGPAEIWDEVKEWLEKHGVEAPAELPSDVERRPDMDQ